LGKIVNPIVQNITFFGGILRWLDIESFNGSCAAALGDEMRGRLEACAMALRLGVQRVRILPLSNIDCLPSFYFSSIEYGTEVIAAISHIGKFHHHQ